MTAFFVILRPAPWPKDLAFDSEETQARDPSHSLRMTAFFVILRPAPWPKDLAFDSEETQARDPSHSPRMTSKASAGFFPLRDSALLPCSRARKKIQGYFQCLLFSFFAGA
jgi:hypothetical protein